MVGKTRHLSDQFTDRLSRCAARHRTLLVNHTIDTCICIFYANWKWQLVVKMYYTALTYGKTL